MEKKRGALKGEVISQDQDGVGCCVDQFWRALVALFLFSLLSAKPLRKKC